MTAKEYLQQAYFLDRKAEMLLAKAQRLRESLYGRGAGLHTVRVKSSPHGTLEAAIAQVEEYERQADKTIVELVGKRIEIEKTIAAVADDAQREVLERRYLMYQPWETCFDKRTGQKVIGIDEAMHYSARQIYRIHGEALLSVDVSECQ